MLDRGVDCPGMSSYEATSSVGRIRKLFRLLGIASVITSLAVLVAFCFRPTATPEPGSDEPLVRADPLETYDPVSAGEPLPEGFRQLLPRDVIEPVYDPVFVSPEEVDWEPETLIVGSAIGDDARAYPVSYLNIHEMVNDKIAGIPVLVSW
jgi:hypothetical protein